MKINLKEIVVILRTEGGAEMVNVGGKVFEDLKIVESWDRILWLLESKVVPVLATGGKVEKKVIKQLKKDGELLSNAITGALSFIPGPIGIVCSLIRAIVCFSIPNIPQGLLELLGCIPGGKLGVKGGLLMEKVGARMMKAIKDSGEFGKHCAAAELAIVKIKNINSSVVISKLREIKSSVPNTTYALAEHQITNHQITSFGSLLLKGK